MFTGIFLEFIFILDGNKNTENIINEFCDNNNDDDQNEHNGADDGN